MGILPNVWDFAIPRVQENTYIWRISKIEVVDMRSFRRGMYNNPAIIVWVWLMILMLAFGLGSKLGEWVFFG
jgi:hypothetical protein